MDKADALVFVFSFEDVSSLYEVSQNISKMKNNEPNQPAIIVIGTKWVKLNGILMLLLLFFYLQILAGKNSLKMHYLMK